MKSFLFLRNLLWIVLLPTSLIWALFMYLRRKYYWRRPFQSSLKVISIGNIHLGGSGKTPICAELCRKLTRPVVLTRGYRSEVERIGQQVELDREHGPTVYGDEPWMLAQSVGCPVFVGRDRVALAKKIEQENAGNVILLDDAFQHLQLRRDVDIVVINGDREPWSDFGFPLGELREPWSALASASAVVVTTGDGCKGAFEKWQQFCSQMHSGIYCFEAKRKVHGFWNGSEASDLKGRSVAAFSGLGFPLSFERTLFGALPHHREESVHFIKAYPDHYGYSRADANFLMAEKARVSAQVLVTTEKDWYKVAPFFKDQGEALWCLRIGYEFSKDFWYFLETGKT